MSVTTNYSPDKDTFLKEEAPAVNSGTGVFLSVGRATKRGSTTTLSAVFEFDISALTDPTAIFSATLNLVKTAEFGANSNNVTLKRLDIGFVEASTGG